MDHRNMAPPEEEAFSPQTEKLFSAFIEQYRHSALGSLLKGITHNLNGVLQILSMQMELLQGALSKEGDKTKPSIHLKMRQCLGQIQKMKEMIEIFIQKGIHDDQDGPQRIHLNDLLEEELSLLKNNLFFKHQVKMKQIFSAKIPPLHGYYIDFSQGLSNLIQNAIEAMEETHKKELTLTTETRDHQVQVVIKDTGCGISEEVRPNLFKPFFTTKGESHFGLGLFISKKILTPYGASFSYTCRDGETTFGVLIPLQGFRQGHGRRV